MSANQRAWVITVSDEASTDEVADALRRSGFRVEQVLDTIGCITGRASEEMVSRVRLLAGVEDVSLAPERVDIGPPGESETW